jgi:hypothetical protein
MAQKILTQSFHNRLSRSIRKGVKTEIERIKKNPFEIHDGDTTEIASYPDLSGLVLLKPDQDSDYLYKNSIALYEYIEFKPHQASDPRLWSYLALVTFRDYMDSIRPIDQAENVPQYIISHYLCSGASVKDMLLNDISLLWWTTHLTVRDMPEKYVLTREAHSNQDYTRHLFPGVQGRNTNLRHAVLEYVVNNPDLFKTSKMDKVRLVMRNLNLLAGTTLLPFCSKEEIKEKINSFKDEIENLKKK